MELGWGGFDRAKLDMLILIRIPFSFHVPFLNFMFYERGAVQTTASISLPRTTGSM